MALFRKKTTTTSIPELQEYYASQKHESTGLAWLLAIGSLIVTALIIVALFLGGRWTYRKIANRNKPTIATTGVVTNDTKPESTTNNQPPGSDTNTSTPASDSNVAAQGVSVAQTPTQNSNSAAATTTKASEVPNTGPGSTIAVFSAVLVLAYFAHRTYLLRKSN